MPCDTWDNAVLLCEAEDDGRPFPLRIETKRIAPGETNTWTIEIDGTRRLDRVHHEAAEDVAVMTYEPGGPQEWRVRDLGSQSAYPTITGAIFEFGFSDAILQMWAAFLDELAHGRDGMRQPFHCVTPEEAAATHRLFTAALESQREGSVAEVDSPACPPWSCVWNSPPRGCPSPSTLASRTTLSRAPEFGSISRRRRRFRRALRAHP